MREPITSNRAEQVRKRRRQQAEKRLTDSATLVRRSITPITTRGTAMAASRSGATSSSARRRYHAVSVRGIEVSLPTISFSGPQVKWRFTSFAVSLLLVAALYYAWSAPQFQVGTALIQGNDRIGSEELNATLGIRGWPIFAVVPGALETRLRLSYPELASVHVKVSLPNQVTVRVEERKASILWQQNGGYTWIDDTGVAFRPRGTTDNLITVQALASPSPGTAAANDPLSPLPFLSRETVAAIRTLAPYVPPGSSMVFDPRYGLGWSDNRGWQVFFGGEMTDMARKLQVYQSLIQALSSKGVTPAFIDVEYPSAPYYRMNQ
jgi:cell division septal protein FtsQ